MPKTFNLNFQETKIVAGFDGDKDGKNSVETKLDLKEVYQELLDKGEAKVSAIISYKMIDNKVVASVDTDKDGEPSLEITVDMAEGFKELLVAKSQKA